ncbi:hypothetical protein AAC387_Pa11g2200 [Persea americana]
MSSSASAVSASNPKVLVSFSFIVLRSISSSVSAGVAPDLKVVFSNSAVASSCDLGLRTSLAPLFRTNARMT